MKTPSLNHVYRLVWNEVTQSFIAVCEHTRARGKRSRAGQLAAVAIVLAGGLQSAHAQQAPPVNALPGQGQIAAGQGQIQQGLNQTTIQQHSNHLIINWDSFNVGADARVQFMQPGRDSIALNRVTGGAASSIFGQMAANGQVWLLNPAGIVFGQGASVNVGGLVASSLSLSDADFLAGRYAFQGSTGGEVVNQGRLTSQGGYIALLAPKVSNTGTLQSRQGHVALAAGEAVTLSLGRDDLLGVRVDRAAVDALVQNQGYIQADGGVVTLSARGANALMSEVINTSGVIEARGLSAKGGRIVLDGGNEAGTVVARGTLDASAAQGPGGEISIIGQHIRLQDQASLDASGRDGGGRIHVGGGYQGKDGRFANAASVQVDEGVRVNARAQQSGDGGRAIFWSDDRTTFAGQIDIRGGDVAGNGGLAEVSGKQHLVYQGRTNALAQYGHTGDLLLDPATIAIQVGSATGNIGGDTVTVADLEAQNANVLLQATGNVTFGDLSLNGGDGKLSMANNVSLRVEAGTSGNGSISFANPANTVEVFGTGSIMMVAGSTGAGILTDIGNLIAHGAGSNPGTLPAHDVTSVGSGTPGAGSVTLFGADGLTIAGSIATNGGYVRLWGDSDNASGGGLTLSSPITTKGGNLYVSTGTSDVNLNSNMTLGAGRIFFKADGSYTSGKKVLGGTLSASGNVDINTAFQMNAGASILTDGVIRLSSTVNLNTGAGVLTLRGSAIDFTGAALQNLSTASMRLEPADASVNMVLGEASGFASASTLAALPGIRNLTIGREDGTGIISVPAGGFAFNANGTLELVNRTVNIGTVGDPTATLTNTNGNVTITSDNINIVQAVTANGGAGKVTLRQQTAANELRLGSGLSNSSVGKIDAATLAVGRADGGNLVFDSDISTTATSVHLLSGDRVEGVNGGVSASHLAVTAGGGATISDSAFNFTTLAASLGGGSESSITSSSTNWGLGTVDGLSGLVRQAGATGAATLTASNTLSLNAPINFNNTATTLHLRAATLNASSASVSNQTLATVTMDRADLGVLTVGGTAGAIQQASLARFNNVRNLVIGNTSRDLSVVGAVSVGVGNRLTLQGQTVNGISGGNTLTATTGSMKVESAQGGLSLDAAVSAAAGTLMLTSDDGASIGGSGTLTANQLAVRTGGVADLDGSTHQVGTLAGDVGSLTFRNGRALTVGSVDGLVGVTATGTVDVRTSGATSDLTLAQRVSAGNAGNAAVGILLASSRNFINNVGSNALQLANGGWRVYSTSPLADTRDGLSSDFKQYNATTASTVLGSGNGFLYSVAPSLTAGLTGVTSKIYDASTAASLLAGNFTLSGAIDGDAVGLNLAGMSASYNNKNVGTAKTVTADGLALASASQGGAAVYGYQLTSTSTSGAIGSITQRSIAVSDLAAASKVYDGNTTASLGLGNAIVSGDAVSLAGTGLFDTQNVGTGKNITVSGLSLSGADASNYQLATTSGSLSANITPKTLTVGGATVSNKVYDGGTVATVSAVALTGVVSGDSVGTSATGAFDTKNAGMGKTVTVSGVSLTGGDAGNYTVSSTTTSGSASITPKSLTVGTATVSDKVYDGGTVATVSAVVLTGVVSGDSVGTSATGAFDTKNAGTGKTVTVSGVSLTGGDAGNYTVSSTTTSGTASITPKNLTVGTATVSDKVYDGGTVATVSAVALSGVVGGDSVGTSATGAFDTKNVGTGKTVTVSGVGLTGGDAGNYTVSSTTTSGSASITPKNLTVGTATVSDKVYDGGTVATVSVVALSGVVGGDSVGTSATGAFDTKNAGTGKTVTVSGVGLTGGDAGNYTVSSTTTSGTASITPKSLTVGGAAVADKTFDGTLPAQVIDISLAGVVSGDNVAATGSGLFSDLNVGKDKLVQVSGIALNGADAGNYQLVATTTESRADINPVPSTPGVTAQLITDGGGNGSSTGTQHVSGNTGGAVSGVSSTQTQAVPVSLSVPYATLLGGGAVSANAGAVDAAAVLDMGSLLSHQGTASLLLVGQGSQSAVTVVVPLYRADVDRGNTLQTLGQYVVTDAGDRVVLSPTDRAASHQPGMTQPVTWATQSNMPLGNGQSAVIRVSLLADGTLLIALPVNVVGIPAETVSAYGLALAKLDLGVSLRQVRAVVLTSDTSTQADEKKAKI